LGKRGWGGSLLGEKYSGASNKGYIDTIHRVNWADPKRTGGEWPRVIG
jgi:hypothetical protein